MCKFCETLMSDTKSKLIWNVRSTMADNNIHEYLEELNDYKFVDDQCNFTVSGYEIDGNTYVGIDYNQVLKGSNIGEITIYPFSEGVQFNYCPMCGKQISKNIKEFTGDGYGIYIEENE